MDLTDLQERILERAAKHPSEPQFMQVGVLLRELAEGDGSRGAVLGEQLLLTAFNDLVREGVLGWGYDLDNPGPPYFHITLKGKEMLP